ncbi:hypothetical protein V8C86DRAFT_2465744 [Haematococcus lacustris]
MLTAPSPGDPRKLLLEKEKELNALRDTALREIDTQLQVKDQELRELTEKFGALRSDFEYNLKLLADRDSELQQYDSDAALQTAILSDKDKQLSELQLAYQQQTQELKAVCAAQREEQFAFHNTKLALQRQLEDERAAAGEALLRAQEHHDQARRALQRSLKEAEDELSRQQREMAAGFTLQVQQLELKYRQKAEDAQQEAAVAKALAQQREEEARAAHARELEQMTATESALADARRHEHNCKALGWELSNSQKLADDAVTDLVQQTASLKHQLRVLREDSDASRADLTQHLAAATASLDKVRADAAAAAELAQAQQDEQAALSKQKLEQAQARIADLSDQLLAAQAALQATQRNASERVTAHEQALSEERASAAAAAAELEHKHGSQLRAVKEALWAREEEVKVLRERLEALKRTLEERRQHVVSYKEQLVAAGERERELQRRLVGAELRLEELGDAYSMHGTADTERLAQALLRQRDIANAAMQDAQLRLLEKEMEVKSLRDQVLALSPRRGPQLLDVAARMSTHSKAVEQEPGFNPTLGSDMAGPNTQPSAGAAAGRGHPQGRGGYRRKGPAEGGDGGNGEVQGRAEVWVGQAGQGFRRPTRLRMPGEAVLQHQGPTSSKAAEESGWAAQGLPSPLQDLALPSPRSASSFWAGVLSTPELAELHQGPDGLSDLGGGKAAAASASAAAAHAAEYLRSSREEWAALMQPWKAGQDLPHLSLPSPSLPPASPSPNSAPAQASSPHHPAQPNQAQAQGQDTNASQPSWQPAQSAAAGLGTGPLDFAWQQTLSSLEAQNAQLRSTLAMMRGEMEALQQAAAAAAQVAQARQGAAGGAWQGDPRPGGRAELPLDTALMQAELQESDEDLQQALRHIQVLQIQMRLQQDPLAPRAPHLSQASQHPADFTPAAGSAVLESGAQAVGAVRGGPGPVTELAFLQESVRDMMQANRRLRREVLRLRLPPTQPEAPATSGPSPAGTGASSAGLVPAETAPPNRPPAMASDAGGAPNETLTAMASVNEASAAQELHSAQQWIQRLASENEQLMELSNALRCERDRLAAQLASVMPPADQAGSKAWQDMAGQLTSGPRSPHHGPGHASMGTNGPGAGLMAGLPAQGWEGDGGQAEYTASLGGLGTEHMAGGPQAGQTAGLPGQPGSGGSGQQWLVQQASVQDGKALKGEGQGRVLPEVRQADGAGASPALLPHTEGNQTVQCVAPVGANAGSSQQTSEVNAPQQPSIEQPASADQAAGSAPVSAAARRSTSPLVPASTPGSASSKETASQRAKLKALQQRRQPSTAGNAKFGQELSVDGVRQPMRVRNYNVHDDTQWHESAQAVSFSATASTN